MKNENTLAEEVRIYIMEHIEKRMTIEELSKQFFVSQTQLKTHFKEVYGESISAYSRKMKMKIAAETLKNENHTVLETALAVGYENGSKFAKAFKNIYGMTPGEYRKHFLENEKKA